MPSTPDPIGGNELQAAGENLNVWGAPKLNQVITNLAFMIAGRVSYACNGSYTPTTTNYVANEFRAFIHDVTGTGGAITMPARPFVKLFRNGSSGTITVACGGVSATILAGRSALIWSNATDCFRFWDNDAGGARLNNIGAPLADTDAATKKYVDDASFSPITPAFPALTGNKGRVLTVNNAENNVGWINLFPAQTGKVGQFFRSLGADPDGSGPSGEWAYPINPAVTIAGNYTAANGDRLKVNTAAGAFNITLPASPVSGDRIVLMDGNNGPLANGWATNTPTLLRNGNTIFGQPDDYLLNIRGGSCAVVYRGTTWEIELGNA